MTPGPVLAVDCVPRMTQVGNNDNKRRLCQKYALWAPRVKDTHNIGACIKWFADGTLMRKAPVTKKNLTK